MIPTETEIREAYAALDEAAKARFLKAGERLAHADLLAEREEAYKGKITENIAWQEGIDKAEAKERDDVGSNATQRKLLAESKFAGDKDDLHLLRGVLAKLDGELRAAEYRYETARRRVEMYRVLLAREQLTLQAV